MTTASNPPATASQPDIVRSSAPQLSREQVDLLKRTIARDTTDDELQLFVATCNRLGLDPFARQIHCVKRWDGRARREVMAIQVGIDGFRTVASRTGELDGQAGPFWCGGDGAWRDVWLDGEPPAACKVLVYRRGCAHPFTGIATYRSYVQTTKEGRPNAMWTRGADFMIAKCAEAVALRKAFPSDLAGVYAPEELAADDREDERPTLAVQREQQIAREQQRDREQRHEPLRAPPAAAEPSTPAFNVEHWSARLQSAATWKDLREVGAALNGLDLSAADRSRLLREYKDQGDMINAAVKAEQTLQAGAR